MTVMSKKGLLVAGLLLGSGVDSCVCCFYKDSLGARPVQARARELQGPSGEQPITSHRVPSEAGRERAHAFTPLRSVRLLLQRSKDKNNFSGREDCGGVKQSRRCLVARSNYTCWGEHREYRSSRSPCGTKEWLQITRSEAAITGG